MAAAGTRCRRPGARRVGFLNALEAIRKSPRCESELFVFTDERFGENRVKIAENVQDLEERVLPF